MNLDGIRVKHAALDQAAGDMRQKVKEIDDRLDRLERELEAVEERLGWSRPDVVPDREGEVEHRDRRDARPADRGPPLGRPVERRLRRCGPPRCVDVRRLTLSRT